MAATGLLTSGSQTWSVPSALTVASRARPGRSPPRLPVLRFQRAWCVWTRSWYPRYAPRIGARWLARCRPGRWPWQSAWRPQPMKVEICSPVAASQIRTVPSRQWWRARCRPGRSPPRSLPGPAGDRGRRAAARWPRPRSAPSGRGRRWPARCRPGRSPPRHRPVWPVRAARCWPVAGVPDPHRPVVAGGGQPGAVRGDRHRVHTGLVWPVRAARCCPVAGVPDPHRPVLAAGGEPGAVRGDRHRGHRARCGR